MLTIEEAHAVAEKYINRGRDGREIRLDARPRAFGYFVDARELEEWEKDPTVGGPTPGMYPVAVRVNCLTGEAVEPVPPHIPTPDDYPDWYRVSRELWRRMNEKGMFDDYDTYTGVLVEPEDPDQPWLSL
ncbi:hypothetical protein C1Y63_09835 [Corynebacterium sp. 13CS0277]|uniref:hypothetical protein n=1 Tax=Corynebacterium sp. 13CS0277 TaxID=2071994 RepID=UPI000D0297A5|nr:hypothetical protein [Corynebacterium sp. 13CS0277]PRQ10750.1 hypothetical protein C1Y63_09835 [Corynebacterium sp. 13CS0277]